MQRWLASRVYYGWVMVASALAINAVSAIMNPVVFSFMLGPMSADLGVRESTLSWAFTLRLFAAGIIGPIMGVLIDRHGARWLGAISGVIVGVSMLFLAGAEHLWVVYLMFVVSGLAGLGGPAGQLLTQVPIAKWFVIQRGRALSITTMGLAGGTVAAVPLTQWLIDTVGWRTATVIYGLAAMGVVSLVSALFVRRSPEDLGLHPDGADHPPAEEGPDASSKITRIATTEDWTVKEALRTPAMWSLLLALTLSGTALTGTLVHRVSYWRDTGMSSGLVAFGTMLDPLIVVFSVFLFGSIADRIPVRHLGSVGLFGVSLSIIPLITTNGETYTIILHGVLWGVSVAGYVTLNNLVWPNYYGRRHLGAIRGITLPVSIAASGSGALLFGYLLDSSMNPRQVWGISLAGFALAAVLVFFTRPPRRSAPTTETVPGPRPRAAV